MKYKTRQNIIIYGSLLIAILLIAYVGKEYYDNRNTGEKVLGELEDVFGKKSNNNIDIIVKEEPGIFRNVDKLSVVEKYLDDILSRRIESEVLKYEIISTWGEYKVDEIKFIRMITDNYIAYDVDIVIPNIDAKITGRKNNEKTTKESLVVTIEFDLLINEDKVSVKNIKI